jgi:hypothetical protein
MGFLACHVGITFSPPRNEMHFQIYTCGHTHLGSFKSHVGVYVLIENCE